ncbi:MAG: pimeloyl-ACP methyl ester carboxylesterase [Alphaproteobacteria bacterium]|jgi:pimeloyl-ACP methyl ester carboxylesterase
MNRSPKDKSQSSSTTAANSRSQGVGRLTIDAVLAITNIVESMHIRVSPLSKVKSTTEKEQLSGISGLVYRNIRNVTELVGKSIDAPLASISKVLASQPDSTSTQALLAALNGVLGDHLVDSENPLAISMHFRREGQSLNEEQLRALIKQSNGKLLIMAHGLCMNDLQWCAEGHDHGAELAKESGMGAIYLHYNTGRHISDNGQQFASLLESLVALSDKNLEINILAHSMGGLVSRSAIHVAQNSGHKWPELLNKLVFLGTPHHGADLEKAGNWIDLILGAHSYTVPFARLVKVRSSGITDLRYGNVQELDWHTTERFEFNGDQRLPLPLPDHVKCFAVATSAKESITYPLGDGLVRIKSALGEHQDKAFDLNIPDIRKWVGTNINHMQLLSDPNVYQVLKTWFEIE